jgi:anti-sigma factor RsiW
MMNRRCEQTVPLLGPFVDGELPADDRAWVQDHLDGCASCTERRLLFLAQGAALRETLRARAAATPMAGFADAVMARVAREGRARKPWDGLEAWAIDALGPHRLGFGATAGVALAACLALAFFLRAPSDGLLVARSDGATQVTSASIDAIDFDDRSNGAVLQLHGIAAPKGPTTTVIWVSDQPARGLPQ